VILHNPTLDLTLPSWRLLPRATINQEQARRRMAHPDPHTNRGRRSRAILELLYGTGLRVSECERLDLADVSLGQGVLFVRDGKGRKDRVVPLLGRAADALDIYLREARPVLLKDPHEPALFLTKHGTRVRAKNIQYLVRLHARRGEIPQPLSPHQLRHACATHLLQRGADVRHVQRLLGHASLDSTAIYTEVAPVDLSQAIDRAHPALRPKDVPSWAAGSRPKIGESGKDFADRLCREKYGPGNYPTGPGSEFNKIKKWGDRAFVDPQ
jgi:integrase/recombinase XerD